MMTQIKRFLAGMILFQLCIFTTERRQSVATLSSCIETALKNQPAIGPPARMNAGQGRVASCSPCRRSGKHRLFESHS
jgi:hypothetical protein